MTYEDPGQHFVGKVSQRAIIVHEGKFLLQRDKGAVHWDVPGGRLHHDEKPHTGLVREVREELGIDIEPGSIVYTDVELYSDGTWVYMVYYAATLAQDDQPFVPDPAEVAEIKWCDKEEIAQLQLYPGITVALQKYQHD